MSQADFSFLPFGAGGIPANENGGVSLRAPRWYFGTAAPTSGLAYHLGDILFNATPSTGPLAWVCTVAGVGGTAVFVAVQIPGNGAFPNTASTTFGSSVAVTLEQGVLNRQISAAGVQPGATAADNVLAFYSLPANAFDGLSNRTLSITAKGSFGATGNNKRIKLFFNPATAVVGATVGAGGTLLADTGTVATNTGGWQVSGDVVKYGAAGSNTQFCLSNGAISGAVANGVSAPAAATAVENAPILIAVTGNATTAASDIVFNWLEVIGKN